MNIYHKVILYDAPKQVTVRDLTYLLEFVLEQYDTKEEAGMFLYQFLPDILDGVYTDVPSQGTSVHLYDIDYLIAAIVQRKITPTMFINDFLKKFYA